MAKDKGTIEERLIRSMQQAVEIKEGRAKPSREYTLPLTARAARVPAAPEYTANEVIAIREKLKLSQAVFAQALNVNPGTVRSWEQGAKPPQGAARRLLEIAARSPQTILAGVEVRSAPTTPGPKPRVSRAIVAAAQRHTAEKKSAKSTKGRGRG